MTIVIPDDEVSAVRRRPQPAPVFFELSDSAYTPVAFTALEGWRDDNHSEALAAFRISCRPILATRSLAMRKSDRAATEPQDGSSPTPIPPPTPAVALRVPCLEAKRLPATVTAEEARRFFEQHFVALRIVRLGDEAGFVTGYYEPIVDGARARSEAFPVPVYRRPSNLFVRGYRQDAQNLPNRGSVYRKIGRRKLVPYYDRGAIEDGVLAGRGLEIAWVRSHTDLLFMQIQGSARIRLADGGLVRINYDAHNGHPFTPIGRVLIDRGLVPREEMSMQRIRQWIADNPDKESELRRQNKAYVFFREVKLAADAEPVGAQGVALTPGRSIAIDPRLHAYGTPVFIDGTLPAVTETPAPFRRLMIAQDTGSAIVGPARADLYFGAGGEAGRIAGRIRHQAQFTLLIPRALDPVEATHTVPLPVARPARAPAAVARNDAESPGPAMAPVMAPVVSPVAPPSPDGTFRGKSQP